MSDSSGSTSNTSQREIGPWVRDDEQLIDAALQLAADHGVLETRPAFEKLLQRRIKDREERAQLISALIEERVGSGEHEARVALMGRVVDLIQRFHPTEGDRLELTLEGGEVVTISADRLRLEWRPHGTIG